MDTKVYIIPAFCVKTLFWYLFKFSFSNTDSAVSKLDKLIKLTFLLNTAFGFGPILENIISRMIGVFAFSCFFVRLYFSYLFLHDFLFKVFVYIVDFLRLSSLWHRFWINNLLRLVSHNKHFFTPLKKFFQLVIETAHDCIVKRKKNM